MRYRKPTDYECPECGTKMDDTCDGFYECDECGHIISAPGNAQQQVQADSPKTITPEHPHASMLFDL